MELKIWSIYTGGKLPFSVSTNAGGTLELSTPDKDGFDSTANLFFRALSEELYTPKVLVCPQDRDKKPAANWASLAASNITYRVHLKTNIRMDSDTPREVIAVCPIDGNMLYSDGAVVDKNGKALHAP